MEAFNPRDTGPFTPIEAAKRVKLASEQLKYFTLCHPHWHSAHCLLHLLTENPLPPLAPPKSVWVSSVDQIEGTFKASPTAEEVAQALIKAEAGLARCARVYFALRRERASANLTGLDYLSLEFNPASQLELKVEVLCSNLEVEGKAEPFIEAASLDPALGWNFSPGYKRKGGESGAYLSIQVDRKNSNQWQLILSSILSRQPQPLSKGNWFVDFGEGYNLVRESLGRNRVVWRSDYATATGIQGKPEDLIAAVNSVGFPGKKADILLDCTVDQVDGFLDLFTFVRRCKPCLNQAIGIFETDKGKQGFLMFKSSPKGIHLITLYGQNGWETLHEELRRTGGKLSF